MEQRALDCNTGLNRELTSNEKLLIQNDKHLSSHLKIQEMLEEIQIQISELSSRIEDLETVSNAMYWEVFDEPNEELHILNPKTNIED